MSSAASRLMVNDLFSAGECENSLTVNTEIHTKGGVPIKIKASGALDLCVCQDCLLWRSGFDDWFLTGFCIMV